MADYSKLIDAETWAFIDRTNSFYPPDAVDHSVEEQRRTYDRMCREFHAGQPEGVSAETTASDTPTHAIPIRIYRNARADDAAVVLYFHGGGFILGGLDSHDDVCAEICQRTGYEVVSVDYRLVPEDPVPGDTPVVAHASHIPRSRVDQVRQIMGLPPASDEQLRRGVEAAFDQFEKIRQPPDYGADLGKIIQFLAIVEERLAAVEQSPILRNGPEHYARALERSGEGLVRTAAQQLEGKGQDLEREAQNLAAYTKSAYDRKSQDLRMWISGGGGLFVGVTLFLPRGIVGVFARLRRGDAGGRTAGIPAGEATP